MANANSFLPICDNTVILPPLSFSCSPPGGGVQDCQQGTREGWQMPAAVDGRLCLFTPSQLEELQVQLHIYKSLLMGVPVRQELLFSICRSLESMATRLYNPHQLGDHSCFGKKYDPEPGRCRRTDGKKWRCTKGANPGSKYCERHMHRGRQRWRKPVRSLDDPSVNGGSGGWNLQRIQLPHSLVNGQAPFSAAAAAQIESAASGMNNNQLSYAYGYGVEPELQLGHQSFFSESSYGSGSGSGSGSGGARGGLVMESSIQAWGGAGMPSQMSLFSPPLSISGMTTNAGSVLQAPLGGVGNGFCPRPSNPLESLGQITMNSSSSSSLLSLPTQDDQSVPPSYSFSHLAGSPLGAVEPAVLKQYRHSALRPLTMGTGDCWSGLLLEDGSSSSQLDSNSNSNNSDSNSNSNYSTDQQQQHSISVSVAASSDFPSSAGTWSYSMST